MNMPVLYYDALSSQARSCYMLIKLLKIDVEFRPTDSIKDINFLETYTWINSFCILPTLVDGNITLCNGHSILIYLCEKYATSNLSNICPRDYIGRLQIMSMLFYEGCILYRCLSHLLADIFLAKYPNFNTDYHRNEVSSVYNSLNIFLKGHTFMVGNRLTIADLAIVSTVSAINIIFPIDNGKFPDLFKWFQSLKKKEFYNSNDEGILKLRYLLSKIGKFPLPSPFGIVSENKETHSDKSNIEGNANDSPRIIRENTVKSKTLESTDLTTDITDSSEKFGHVLELDIAKENERRFNHEVNKFNYYNAEATDSENNDFLWKNMEQEDFKEIFRRDVNSSHPTANDYTMCCYYFPNNMRKAVHTDEKVDCDCSFQTPINSKKLWLKEIKSYMHIQYYDFNTNNQDYGPCCSKRRQGVERSKEMSCSCTRNLYGKNFLKKRKTSYSKNLLKSCKNNETDTDLSSEESKKCDSSDRRSNEEIKYGDLKIKRIIKQNATYNDKKRNFKANNQSEVIIKNKDDNIEIEVSPKQEDKPKNYTNVAVGNNEDNNAFNDEDFQTLLAKVVSFEKILEDLKSQLADKALVNKSSQISRNSSLDIQVEDSSLEQSLNKMDRNSSRNPILHTKVLDYSSVESSTKDEDFIMPKGSHTNESASVESHEKFLPHNLTDDNNEKNFKKYSLKDNTDNIASTSQILESNLENLQINDKNTYNSSPSQSNNTENLTAHNSDQSIKSYKKYKRLEAGCNSKPQKNQTFKNYFPTTTIQMKQGNKRIMENNLTQSNEEIIKIIYHICMKSSSKYKTKCCCHDCFMKEKIKETKSKIPRLIALNGTYHKIYSKSAIKEIG